MTGIRHTLTARTWIFLIVAVALPLAAVALYFAVFAPPPPPPVVAVSSGPGGSAPAGLPPNHPPIGGGAQGGERVHPQIGGGAGRAVQVPETVKGKWRAVKLEIQTKGGEGKPQTLLLDLGSEASVPGSKLKVRADEFLPALQVKGNEITSASNEPTNPAALVTIWEDGKQVFHGWLFSKFPDMQPFEHPIYRITLIGGVPKS